MHRYIKPAIMALVVGASAGCGSDQATRLAGYADGSSQRADDVAPGVLHAGLSLMQPRVQRTVEGYSKIEPTAQFRYFMHPTMEKDALIEFNVAGLAEMTLSPRIGDLDANCSVDQKAGEIALSYALDGNAPTSLVVDRNYDRQIVIKLSGARTLTVTVNQGNGVVTCDWFGLGVMNVK